MGEDERSQGVCLLVDRGAKLFVQQLLVEESDRFIGLDFSCAGAEGECEREPIGLGGTEGDGALVRDPVRGLLDREDPINTCVNGCLTGVHLSLASIADLLERI